MNEAGETEMATEDLDLVDEIFASLKAPAEPAAPDRVPGRLGQRARVRSGSRRSLAAKLVLAFVLGGIACLLVVAAVALAAFSAYSNRVVPGVRVGSVDLSGLNRDQTIARLKDAYASLAQGEATVTTPIGTETVTYQEAGRAPDLQFMADAAMRFGHTGSPIDDAVAMFRSATGGETVPIAVLVDPTAVATRIRELVGTTVITPKDARVTVEGATFVQSPSTLGYGLDEKAIAGAIVDSLAKPDAPAHLQVSAAFVELDPQVSSQDAADAAAAAEKMAVAFDLTWGGAAQAASPSKTPAATKFTVDPQTIRSWISFGTAADGSYGVSVDSAQVQAYVSAVSEKVTVVPPVEPSVVYAVSLKNGKDGIGVDVAATAQAIEARLASLASGQDQASTMAIATGPIPPRLTLDSLSGAVVIGGWTTVFFPDISNGFGANIRVPAALLNGQVIAPGQQFSFLKAVGPIDSAHGYTLGGVIEQGKSNHTGAMGGGICSASTTMFNAAARAGLKIDERHAHFYYISRYPVGLDATVFSNGVQVWDLKWTNDTPNPIVIRASAPKGSKSKITIELLSLPLNRTVTFSPEFKANVVGASDRTQYVTTLKPGQQNRAEYPTPGFDTSRTRTVTDSAGNVIHVDTWNSHYTKVDGLLQIGRAAAPAPSPAPVETPPAPAELGPATLTEGTLAR
jgi:vancomycin resistance protein YoaR